MSYMKDRFDAILIKFGHDIYLNRRVRGEDEGSYSPTFEKWTVRHRGSNSTLANAQDEAIEGILSSSDRIYYFQSEAQPFDGDRIYETDPRVQRPVDQTVWQVDTAIPLRGVNGDIDYYVAGASRIRPN